MKGYMQFFDNSGNHSSPWPDDYVVFTSMENAKSLFEDWVDEVSKYSDPQQAEATLFIGEPGDSPYPCDTYPDFMFNVGPRGGINKRSL